MYPACKGQGEVSAEFWLVGGRNYDVLALLQTAKHTDFLGVGMRYTANHWRHGTRG